MASYGVRTINGTPTNGTSAVQTVTINGSPAGGTFRLSYGGQVTNTIAYNAPASAVQTALRALSRIGSTGVSVTGSNGGPYTVTFGGPLAAYDVLPLQVATNSLTGGTNPSVSIAETTPGVTATSRGAPAGAELVDTSSGVRYVNYGTTTAPIWVTAPTLLTNAGAPTDGGSGTGAGWAGKGSICSDTTNGIAYINTGTAGSPTWTKIGTQT